MSGKYPQVGAVLITTFGRSGKEWHVLEGSNIERYLVQKGGGQGRRVQGRKKVFDIIDVISINNRCTYNVGLFMVLVKFLLWFYSRYICIFDL